MKKTALDIYRSLPQSERATYEPPSGMRGAPAVRELQEIAYCLDAHKRGGYYRIPDRLLAMRTAYGADTRDMSLALIPLGPHDSTMANDVVTARNRRLKNWNHPEATTHCSNNLRYKTIDEGRYSSRCSYTHYTYTPMMLSAGRISDDGSVLGAVINTGRYTLPAPRGYRWGTDANGIRLYRTTKQGDDFHPTSDDIRAGIRHIVRQLRKNAETRLQARREKQQQDAAEKMACAHGIWVSVDDSRDAGNCAAGTIAYCERHGLDRARHYRAEVLLRAEDSSRVRSAIAAAKKRQLADWKRGYSNLPAANRLQVAV